MTQEQTDTIDREINALGDPTPEEQKHLAEKAKHERNREEAREHSHGPRRIRGTPEINKLADRLYISLASRLLPRKNESGASHPKPIELERKENGPSLR